MEYRRNRECLEGASERNRSEPPVQGVLPAGGRGEGGVHFTWRAQFGI